MEPSERDFAEALHQAHTDLLRDLRQLEEAVRPGSAVDQIELGRRLGKVQTLLSDHFRFEEQGGYMGPLLKEEPRFEPVVADLLDEHRQLAQGLDALLQELLAAIQLQERLREKVRTWLKHVRQHEARENNLVQDVYYSSDATGD